MGEEYVLPSATRRVKLFFNEKGDPAYPTVTSAKGYQQHALGVLPPRDVIPIVFVPGIAGSLLKVKGSEEVAWNPGESAIGALGLGISGKFQSPGTRQRLLDPDNTEVMKDGGSDAKGVYWLDDKETKRRGWGSVHKFSYLEFLKRLERTMNDQYMRPGYPEELGNHILAEFGMLEYLNGGSDETTFNPYPYTAWARPDYAARAKRAMEAWGEKPKAFSKDELKRAGDYFFPVWAYGYNWLRSNEEAAEGLVKFIKEEVLTRYQGKYFRHQGRVIIVTHSMGGLVARFAAMLAPAVMLGVIHGVQPVMGAACLYRRLRAGQEVNGFFDVAGQVAAGIMGGNEEKMSAQLACSPGALQLAPTCDYGMDWLEVVAEGDLKPRQGVVCGTQRRYDDEIIFTLPKQNPYVEIYSKTTDDAWWGLVRTENIDPSGKIKKRGNNPVDSFNGAVKSAEKFHKNLGNIAHPLSYGFYGIDEEEYRSFNHVKWKFKYVTNHLDTAEEIKNAKATRFNSGEVKIHMKYKNKYAENGVAQREGTATLTNERDQRGDGTVPEVSGKWLRKLSPSLQEVFAMAGYDHQKAFDNQHAFEATIYFIMRLIQKAAPPKTGF